MSFAGIATTGDVRAARGAAIHIKYNLERDVRRITTQIEALQQDVLELKASIAQLEGRCKRGKRKKN